jgi:hypothetical protein
LGYVDFAHQAEVSRGIIGASEAVAAIARETVVEVVPVLVGVAVDGGVDRASAACGHDAGNFPVVSTINPVVSTINKDKISRQSAVRGIKVPSVVGMRLGA